MKRIILLVVAVVATVIPMATAQASPTATCHEIAGGPAPYQWPSGQWDMRGQGTITCTANTGPIDVHVRLIKNGVLQPVGIHTCSWENYCTKFVYAADPWLNCWKVRVWGFIGPNNNPTGATTSPEACF